MSRNKNKRKNAKKPLGTPISIVFPDNISADEMKHIIAGGLAEFEDVQRQKKQHEQEQKELEWQSKLGAKDFSSMKGLKWRIKQFYNDTKVAMKILLLPSQRIKSEGVTFRFIQMVFALFFGILSIGLLLLAICLWIGSLVGAFWGTSWQMVIIGISLGTLALTFYKVFGVISREILNMTDQNYLLGLSACITSIMSLIVAIATLIIAQK